MNEKELQNKINKFHYWDARVIKLECNHFADEVILEYDDIDGNITYRFLSCYKVKFEHYQGYFKEKPSKDLNFGQIPYFLQNVEISKIEQEQILYVCKLLLPPLELEIWCKNIDVSRQNS